MKLGEALLNKHMISRFLSGCETEMLIFGLRPTDFIIRERFEYVRVKSTVKTNNTCENCVCGIEGF